jgi:hypothetical protein
MALSNIFVEPRREITESVVGTVGIFGLFYADYRFGVWLQSYMERTVPHDPRFYNGFWVMGMVIGFVAVFLAVILAIVTHAAGEAICNALADRGLELRPTKRWYR